MAPWPDYLRSLSVSGAAGNAFTWRLPEWAQMCQGKTICSLAHEMIVCRKGLILSNLAKKDTWDITERFKQMQSESPAFGTYVSNVSNVSDGTLGTPYCVATL